MFYKTNDIVSLDGWSLLHPAPMQTPLWWVTIHLKIGLWGIIFHHYYGDDDGDNKKMMMAMKDDYKRDVISGVTFHSECDDGVRTCGCWQSHCSQQIFTVRWTCFYGGMTKVYICNECLHSPLHVCRGGEQHCLVEACPRVQGVPCLSPCSGLISVLGGGSDTTSGCGGWWVVGPKGPRSPISPCSGLIGLLGGGSGFRGVDGGRFGGGQLQETPGCLHAQV